MIAAHLMVYSELNFSSVEVHLKQRHTLDLLGWKTWSYPGGLSIVIQVKISSITLPYDLRKCRNRRSL